MGKKISNRADELVFGALKKAIEEEKIHVLLLNSQINRPNSPVYNPWEFLLPILLPVLIGLLLILAIGPILGLLFMVALILISTHIIKKKLDLRLLERSKQFMLSSLANCEQLWEFGGVVLVNSNNKKTGCIAPDGDWKEFIIANFSELMVEKKEEKEPDEKAK